MMNIRRFKQIGVTEGYEIESPIFSKPVPPVKPGDVVMLSYMDGTEDTLIVQLDEACLCDTCAYYKGCCPRYTVTDEIYNCIFGEGFCASRTDSLLEEL